MREIEVRMDTTVYRWENNQVMVNGRPQLLFEYVEENVVAELMLYPRRPYAVRSLELLSAPDWIILDSLLEIEQRYYRTRVKFEKLSQLSPPALQIRLVRYNGDTINTVVPLFHVARTTATIPPGEHVLYIGEEKVFPLQSSLPRNIKPEATWQKRAGYAYRITTGSSGPQLHLIPLRYGTQNLRIPFQTYRPEADSTGHLRYQQVIEPFDITVKRGQVQFLPLSTERVLLPREERFTEQQVSFDRQVSLNLDKPYRLETRERGGGPLIGELYIQEIRRDAQMVATLRVYNYHRRSEGPLYLKSQDEPVFLTNFDILPPSRIEYVEVRKANGDWSRDLRLQPGDRFDLRILGESLLLSDYALEGLPAQEGVDSTMQGQRIVWTGLQVPLDLKRRRLPLTREGRDTDYAIEIEEYQRPRDLDFVNVRIGPDSVSLDQVPRPVFITRRNRDVLFSFSRDSIDQGGDLYGPQYLVIEAEVWDKENRLIEKKRVKELCLCPGEQSPRQGAYLEEDCFEGRVSINDLLGTPVYELPAWAQIRIAVRHQREPYQQGGQQLRFKVIVEKKVELGLEFSTPVGVVMKRFGTPGSETLNTVNFAAMLQIGLYEDHAINQLQPIQLGVGLMAVDVFPFNGEARRDLVLGSFLTFYPIDVKQRWNVPLYLGGGYLLNTQKAFFFLGPGLSIRL